jgi:hypothetical protein
MLNIFIVFLISGLWHGAAWTFVLWGVIHGVYQIIGALTQKPREKAWRALRIDPKGSFVRGVRRVITFSLAAFAWIFFRANNFSDLGVLLRKLFTDWSFSLDYFKGTLEDMELTALGIVITVLSLFIMRRIDIDGLSAKDEVRHNSLLGVRYVYLIWIIVFAWLLLSLGDGASAFIYFQF